MPRRRSAKIIRFPSRRRSGDILDAAATVVTSSSASAASDDPQAIIQEIRARMDKIRAYMDALDEWSASGGARGKHPRRVANGVRKVANEVSRSHDDNKGEKSK